METRSEKAERLSKELDLSYITVLELLQSRWRYDRVSNTWRHEPLHQNARTE